MDDFAKFFTVTRIDGQFFGKGQSPWFKIVLTWYDQDPDIDQGASRSSARTVIRTSDPDIYTKFDLGLMLTHEELGLILSKKSAEKLTPEGHKIAEWLRSGGFSLSYVRNEKTDVMTATAKYDGGGHPMATEFHTGVGTTSSLALRQIHDIIRDQRPKLYDQMGVIVLEDE